MPELTYLSLGWGVQSWTIAAMVALGDLPPIDLAIHSDTGHEASGTYAHAEKWTPWLTEHGIQVVTVKPENNDVIREDWGKKSGYPSIQIPAFTLTHPSEDNASGANAKEGQIGRQCTRQWKITPIRRHLRSILGPGRLKPGSVSPGGGSITGSSAWLTGMDRPGRSRRVPAVRGTERPENRVEEITNRSDAAGTTGNRGSTGRGI